MNDATFDRTITALTIVLGLYWFLAGRKNAPLNPANIPLPTSTPLDPNMVNYMQQTGGNPPIAVSGPNMNINIANQGLGFLSNKYVPMFGFIGMAQGVTVQ